MSPYLLIKSLETQLNSQLSRIDILELPLPQQKLLQKLKRDIIDSRLDVQDYELSETRAAQLSKAQEAKIRIGTMQAAIVKASESDIFGPVDVAQLTAQLEQIAALLT